MKTWHALPDTYDDKKKYALRSLSIFGYTIGYTDVYGQFFRNVKYIKNRYRTHFADEGLESCVKIKMASYSPHEQMLCTKKQEQKSY